MILSPHIAPFSSALFSSVIPRPRVRPSPPTSCCALPVPRLLLLLLFFPVRAYRSSLTPFFLFSYSHTSRSRVPTLPPAVPYANAAAVSDAV